MTPVARLITVIFMKPVLLESTTFMRSVQKLFFLSYLIKSEFQKFLLMISNKSL